MHYSTVRGEIVNDHGSLAEFAHLRVLFALAPLASCGVPAFSLFAREAGLWLSSAAKQAERALNPYAELQAVWLQPRGR